MVILKERMKQRWVIGIDEVGRGALAGPLTVGVVAIRKNASLTGSKLPLRDSKKLSPSQREAWVAYMREWKQKKNDIFFATWSMSPKEVDRLNVSQAANWAATKALSKLLIDAEIDPKAAKVFLDGGLYIKDTSARKKGKTAFPVSETIIKGDERVPVIALASIIAKVTRDKKLTKLHDKYPAYHLAKHKGYGTKMHRDALKAHGISDIHRLTFTRKWANL